MSKKMRGLRLSERTWDQLECLASVMRVGDRTRVVEILVERASMKMLKIRFNTGEEQFYATSELAEQAIQDVILNSDAETAELWQGDEVVAEYSAEDFIR